MYESERLTSDSTIH